jgi:hypothetical protein
VGKLAQSLAKTHLGVGKTTILAKTTVFIAVM